MSPNGMFGSRASRSRRFSLWFSIFSLTPFSGLGGPNKGPGRGRRGFLLIADDPRFKQHIGDGENPRADEKPAELNESSSRTYGY